MQPVRLSFMIFSVYQLRLLMWTPSEEARTLRGNTLISQEHLPAELAQAPARREGEANECGFFTRERI